MNRIGNRIKWSYRKNAPDINGILLRNYPNFVISNQAAPDKNAFPVFVFHRVQPGQFEEQVRFLRNNHYVTLHADEFLDYIKGERKGTGREILLTFDDGSISLWSVAYPILEKHGLKAVAFILPGLIQNGQTVRPTLKEVWSGHLSMSELPLESTEADPLCNWLEIEKMHQSGVVDFQSHTLYHALIPVSNRVIDFFHPRFDTYYFGNIFIPLYRQNGHDLVDRRIPFGTPIYASEPRMAKSPRFFDDERIRQRCQNFVLEEGGEAFFSGNWRKKLEAFYRAERQSMSVHEFYETPREQEEAIYQELKESKEQIEARLHKSVAHLCYPWFMGSSISVEQSSRAGYKTNFWGRISGIRENVSGTDPYKIVRLEDRFVFRLPGEGRKSLKKLLTNKIKRYGKLPLGKTREL